LTEEQANRVIVRGVYIIEDSEVREIWNALLDPNLNSPGRYIIANTVIANGEVWPPIATFPGGYWAKYANVESREYQKVIRGGPNGPLGQIRREPVILKRVVANARDEEIIGATSLSLLHREIDDTTTAELGTPFTETFDTTTRLDAARIILTNGSGESGRVWRCSIRGRLVRRLSGSKGRIHERFRDDESIRDNGEKLYEVGNNYIVTDAQVNQLADYIWKDNRTKKHLYKLTLPGEWYEYDPGEWYTVDVGAAGKSENINATCRLLSSQIDRTITGARTTLVFREVEQNWTFDSNYLARAIAAGSFALQPGGRIITVASSTYSGAADVYCDGTADETQIQAAIDQQAGLGGGIVQLTEGTFNIAATISLYSNIAVYGEGENTILDGSSTYIFRGDGADGSELSGIHVRNMTLRDATIPLYFDFVDDVLIDNVAIDSPATAGAIGMSFLSCDRLLIRGCQIYDFEEYGIYLSTCNSVVCMGNIFNGNNNKASGNPQVGIVTNNCVDMTIGECVITDIGTATSTSNNGGIWVQGTSSKNNVVGKCIVRGINGFSTTGIYANAPGTIVAANSIEDVGSTESSNRGIWIAQNQCKIEQNTIDNAWDVGIEVGAINNTKIANNYVVDCGNFMDNSDCESTTPPMIDGETSAQTSNASWARSSTEEYYNTYSYLLTITTGGTDGYATQEDTDTGTTNDMHGLSVGYEYTYSAWVYVPSSGGPAAAEVTLEVGQYYSAAWNWTTDAATGQDAWEKLSVNFTINAAATGIMLRAMIASTASDGEYCYFDTFRLQSNGFHNEHLQSFVDGGTGTMLG
jgi:parallel beta-helix repeat protein